MALSCSLQRMSSIEIFCFLMSIVCGCRDPSGSMIAFSDMMRKQIVMPAHLMDDNEHSSKNGRNLFKDFSAVAQATGTYTGKVRTHFLNGAANFWRVLQSDGRG